MINSKQVRDLIFLLDYWDGNPDDIRALCRDTYFACKNLDERLQRLERQLEYDEVAGE